ncbi:Glycosyltransferase family 9 (heptosyltransferase) [Verrucomicrobium sp. GAS474]|uniref:glycosyltransferase family 9 protein n=1 Tax=Verrucomicrobium sp. GAS474 TaxID=1882831 RepID=UPI00087AAC63|nr:glycosyltransferase family 9 protein [Verrucomicrobium sp. GAS474]SDU09982.1 Glycosyltransferase family 9 (heptosyltransferase) [Verrucomicrobium sp. GAS474]
MAVWPYLFPVKKPKILIVKPDHLGDFAVTLPVIWEVVERFGRENVTILASRPNGFWGEILPWFPRVIEVEHSRYARPTTPSQSVPAPFPLPRTPQNPTPFPQLPPRKPAASGFRTALGLRYSGYTHGIELTSSRHDPWGKIWLYAAGCDWRSGLQGKYDFLLSEKHSLGEGHQKNRMALRFPREWGITGESDPALFMPTELHHHDSDISGEIIVSPFAGQTAKEWSQPKWRDLIIHLRPSVGKRTVTILAGSDRSGNALDLARICGLPDSVVFIPQTIGETLTRLAGAAAVVTLDTAVAHYAWLTGTPTVQIFSGTTDPARWAAVGALQRGTVLTVEPPPTCSPCRLPVCNREGHPCLEGIGVKQVLSALGTLTPLIPG